MAETKSETCFICSENNAKKTLSCTHSFCKGCISKWCTVRLETGIVPSCPTCRTPIKRRFYYRELISKLESELEMKNFYLRDPEENLEPINFESDESIDNVLYSEINVQVDLDVNSEYINCLENEIYSLFHYLEDEKEKTKVLENTIETMKKQHSKTVDILEKRLNSSKQETEYLRKNYVHKNALQRGHVKHKQDIEKLKKDMSELLKNM